MLTPRLLAARLWPSALSPSVPDAPQAPQAENLSQCLLLALLLHALLLLWIGTAPGGTAKPGDGVWGRLNVTLTGGTGEQNAVLSPQAAPTRPQQGPVGKGRQERHGGTVRPTEAPQPLPMTPGAAREGEWASRVPEPGEATEAKEALTSSDIATPVMAQTKAEPAPAPGPVPAPAPAPDPAPVKLPELRALDTEALPVPAALAEPLRNTAVLSAPSGRELPSSPRLRSSRSPSESLGRVPAMLNTVALAAGPALDAKTLPSLPPELRRLEDLPSLLPTPEAPKPLAEVRQPPALTRRLDAPPPRPAALSERLPAIAKSDSAALPPATLSPSLALPAARLPASRSAAVPKLQPLPTMPSEPLAKAPEVPAVEASAESSVVAAKVAEPAASSAALAAAQAAPTVVTAPTPSPVAAATTTAATTNNPQPSPASETTAPPLKAANASLLEPGGARPRLGAPDAGPRLGRDVATPASASPEVKPLNLTLPRGGELSARGSRGVLPLMPLPPERKSKLSESMEEAKRADCRDAYAKPLGLLAVVPLAVDAVRGGTKGCTW